MHASPYYIASRALFVRDTPEHIDFHIKNGDYFAFLATIMGVMQEGFDTCNKNSKEYNLAKEVREDLRYVHKHYKIVPLD